MPVEAIVERTVASSRMQNRLARARRCAAAIASSAPRPPLPLFTSDDLAAIKPSLVVRTAEAFARKRWRTWPRCMFARSRRRAGVWWRRAVRGDALLLAAAHLLTAIGFALLLSRQDPLRDTLLFARYTEGVLLGLGVMVAVSLRELSPRSVSAIQLPAACWRRWRCLSLLMLFGSGPGTSTRKSESRAGATDRSDPTAAGVVPRRLFCPAMGTAAANPQRHRRTLPRAALAHASACRLCAASRRRRRCRAAVLLSSERSRTGVVSLVRLPGDVCRWRAAAWAWRLPASSCSLPASTPATR